MTLRDDLIATKALIDTPDKWCKGSFNGQNATHCAVGALDAIPPYPGRRSVALSHIRSALPEQFKGRALMDYNDDPATTYADIMALFQRAIDAAE